ncbi:hypothetical protein SGGMMB4_01810 [Sodalis glossinidius str. 'morsitans']|uniref:Uncharacterized protein n=1 Tax=Sodalis glossinidius (strain morsitans) TaxID=343509 RepID=A0A193QI64_SODGM|nr:hypothetical protein [Sodalis glossinidius]CRL44615.1 hypothetical protein SGGMMB4_01810 [Sodalis glossinidius str. 'morsitans']
MMAMFSHPGIFATLLGGMMGLLMAVFGCGRARGRDAAQKRANVQREVARREAVAHIVQRQSEVARTSGDIKDEITRLSAGDVDKRLREKWRYPDAAGDR